MKPLKEISLLLTSSMTVMAGAIISPALPEIRRFFAHEPNADFWARLVLTVPALFIALGAPLVGLLVDRWRRKPVLLGAVLLYGVAGSSGLYAPSLNSLLLGRIGLGLAVAGILTCSTTLVGDYFKGSQRTHFLGWQSAAMSFGGVVFVLLGGLLADLSWRAPFAVYLLAPAVLPLLWYAIDEPVRDKHRNEFHSEEAARLPWGLVALLFPLMWLCQVIFYLIPVQLPFHLKSLLDAPGSIAGAAMALFNFCAAMMALQYQRLKAKASYQTLFVLLFGLMGLGYIGIWQSSAYWQIFGSLFVAGTGFGLLMPNMGVWLLGSVPEALRGRAVGGLATAIFLGQFMSPLVAAPRPPVQTLAGLYGVAGLILLAFALCFAVAARQRRNSF
jgi:MFS family permease